LYAYGAFGVGGAALITAGIFGAMASSTWNQAKAVCGSVACGAQADVDRANAIAGSARTKANVSTACAIGGGLLAGAGAYLWFTLPGDVHVAPQAGDTIGLALSGAF